MSPSRGQFVPVAGGSSASNADSGRKLRVVEQSDDNSNDGTCQRSQQFLCRHPEYVSGHYDHPEVRDLAHLVALSGTYY